MESRLTRLLRRWGGWHHESQFYGPYPAENLLYRIAQSGIPDGFRPGSRILCRQMPKALLPVQRAWSTLDEDARQVLFAKYVYDRDDDGKPLSDLDRAKLLDVPALDFRPLLLKARRHLRQRLSVVYE